MLARMFRSRSSLLERWAGPRARLAPRVFPSAGFELIDAAEMIEEERMSIYKPSLFYPVRLGEVMAERYQVVAKLGFGYSSTTWLGHDLQERKFVSLKVHVNTIQENHELKVYEHLKSCQPRLGPLHVRPLESFFQVQGPNGRHDVLVQMPLAIAMGDFQHQIPSGVFNTLIVKEAMKQVVPALRFLHDEAHVIHADFHPGNLLIGLQNPEESLAAVEEAEIKTPSPRKSAGDRMIYASRAVVGNIGPLYLCDFGQAKLGKVGRGRAMPISLRAPEVILGMDWSYPLDMWSVGLAVWDMLHTEKLFDIYDTSDLRMNDAQHLANMIALLGPPSLDFLTRSRNYLEFWDDQGKWRNVVPIPQGRTLESLDQSLSGDERVVILDFIRGLLRWQPEERMTAEQAMSHPWLAR